MRILIAAVPLLLLAACSDDAPVKKPVAEVKQMTAGEYEITGKVTALASTDNTTPKTNLKIGDTTVAKGCVAADGTIAPTLFAEAGDVCKTVSNYVSGGLMNTQVSCTRKGNHGFVTSTAAGSFTADTLTAELTSATAFVGDGDYSMARQITGKRIGNCPAAGATAKP